MDKPFNTHKVSRDDLPEMVGQLIDIFEDFLADRNIIIPNPERDEAIAAGEMDASDDPNEIAILYGTDYGELQSSIEDTLFRWNLAEPWNDDKS